MSPSFNQVSGPKVVSILLLPAHAELIHELLRRVGGKKTCYISMRSWLMRGGLFRGSASVISDKYLLPIVEEIPQPFRDARHSNHFRIVPGSMVFHVKRFPEGMGVTIPNEFSQPRPGAWQSPSAKKGGVLKSAFKSRLIENAPLFPSPVKHHLTSSPSAPPFAPSASIESPSMSSIRPMLWPGLLPCRTSRT